MMANQMNERIPILLGILRDEIRLYQELLECEERKTTLLAEGRVEELEECNKTEENTAIHIQDLEVKRKSLCQKLCVELGIPQEELTPARLAESLDNPRELNETAALLRDVVERVQLTAARNRDLIKKPLHYTEGMLTIFSNAAGPYQPDGTFNAEASILPTFSKDA
jgi:flagellar biosynthesis/type III secretory pathway chaperone